MGRPPKSETEEVKVEAPKLSHKVVSASMYYEQARELDGGN